MAKTLLGMLLGKNPRERRSLSSSILYQPRAGSHSCVGGAGDTGYQQLLGVVSFAIPGSVIQICVFTRQRWRGRGVRVCLSACLPALGITWRSSPGS